jgi:hypothetical protein
MVRGVIAEGSYGEAVAYYSPRLRQRRYLGLSNKKQTQPRWGCVIIIGFPKAGDVVASLGLQ